MTEKKIEPAAVVADPAEFVPDIDRVAMVSLRADGAPDQTPEYEVIVPADQARPGDEPLPDGATVVAES